MSLINTCFFLIRGLLKRQFDLVAENVALRQQLAVLRDSVKHPHLHARHRIFWVLFSRLWKRWQSVLVIVQPETVIKWHRLGFRLYWRWRSRRGQRGRPRISREIRDLIRQMSRDNPTWGAPRILSELQLLGYSVAESTVSKYMKRPTKPPSQNWRTFLRNHLSTTASIDFFTVPTGTFRVLFCFVVLRHERRSVAHFNVTEHPTSQWTAQQVIEAFPYDEAPHYLIRDRDRIFSPFFRRRMERMGIEEVVIALRSPWQNPFVERLIGSIRRECLDYVIVLNARHLRQILTSYFEYYGEARPHLSLDRNSPSPREVEPPTLGKIISIPQVGGLHHRYKRAA